MGATLVSTALGTLQAAGKRCCVRESERAGHSCFRSRGGMVLEHFWIPFSLIFEQFLANFWPTSGQLLASFWPVFGRFLTSFWPIFDRFLEGFWRTPEILEFRVPPLYFL